MISHLLFYCLWPDMSFSLGENQDKKEESLSPISSLLEDGSAFAELEFSHGRVLLVAAMPPLCSHNEISLCSHHCAHLFVHTLQISEEY